MAYIEYDIMLFAHILVSIIFFFDFDFPIQFAGLPLPVADSVVFFRIAATLSSQPGTVREGPGNFFQLSFELFFLRLKDFSDLCRHSLWLSVIKIRLRYIKFFSSTLDEKIKELIGFSVRLNHSFN